MVIFDTYKCLSYCRVSGLQWSSSTPTKSYHRVSGLKWSSFNAVSCTNILDKNYNLTQGLILYSYSQIHSPLAVAPGRKREIIFKFFHQIREGYIPGARWSGQPTYTARKEMEFSEEIVILHIHELVHDTRRKSESRELIRVVSRTNS